MELWYLGHSAWQVQSQGMTLLFDPFLTGNPVATVKAEQLNPDYILLTHGHDDHIGDTVAIAKRTGATVITTYELGLHLEQQGCKVHTMGLGGKYQFSFGYVRVTPAYHGSGFPGGHAAGFVVNVHGQRIYHAGDTALFSDMALITRQEHPLDVALLPIGDNYTMGPDDALLAVEWLQAKTVIPMHYNTFPVIAVDAHAWATRARGKGSQIVLLEPGQRLTI